MATLLRSAVLNDEIIGQVSAYAALPAVLCPSCGAKLYRVFNTQTKWQFACLSEKLLVAPGTDDPPVAIEVD